MSYTKEQEEIALDVLRKDKHAFYEILRVEKTSDDTTIKKSYRKLAIKLHPDKNSHPKASEAFKVINRAFEVLSDKQKREMFDRLGRDPDDRGVASSSGFASSAGAGNNFENMFFTRQHPGGSAPPEDIFDFLFNMNGGSPFGGRGGPFGDRFGPFGGSPFMDGGGATFSFGGPGGFKVYSNNGGSPFFQQRQQRPRQRQSRQAQQQEEQRNDTNEIFRIILPFLLLFLVPLLEKLIAG